jgi:hypothetical protein
MTRPSCRLFRTLRHIRATDGFYGLELLCSRGNKLGKTQVACRSTRSGPLGGSNTARGTSFAAAVLVAVSSLVLAACSSATVETQPQAQHFGCVDDSKHCIDQRQASLKAMLADPKRTWVREPTSAGAYAAGVRMQAFKMEKSRLSCDDLGIGRREADAAPSTLRGPSGQGLTPAQKSRGIIFADEVGRELTNEAKRRCKS